MINFTMVIDLWAVFTLALISPGPDFIIVSSTALSRGRLEGIKAAAGIACVTGVYAFVCLAGLSVLLEHYSWLMIGLKLGGGIYLVYLGSLLIWHSFSKTEAIENPSHTPSISVRRSSFSLGVLTCLTNPKAIVFFASIFSMALTKETTLETKMTLEMMVPLTAFIWFSVVAVGLSLSSMRTRYERWKMAMDRLVGGVLAALGLRLLFTADT